MKTWCAWPKGWGNTIPYCRRNKICHGRNAGKSFFTSKKFPHQPNLKPTTGKELKMNQFSKESAANQLEFAVNLYYLAIEELREVGEQFPELHHLIDRYIDSIHEGEPL